MAVLQSLAAQLRPTNANFGEKLAGLRATGENIASSQQRRGVVDRQQKMQQVQFINRLAKSLKGKDPSEWGQTLTPHLPVLQQMGFDPRQLQGLTPADIDGVITRTDAALGPQEKAAMDTVQSSDILPSGAIIKVMRSGKTVLEDAQGTPLEGKDRAAALKEAAQYKIDLAAGQAGAVERAKSDVKMKVGDEKLAKQNKRDYGVYRTAMDGVISALGGTASGPISGRFPAITSGAQIADNARSILLPAIKGIVRKPGEGTFTDSDQRALEAMLPNRTMTPEAQAMSLELIDNFVKASLGESVEAQEGPQEVSTQEQFDALPSGAVYLEDGVEYRKP